MTREFLLFTLHKFRDIDVSNQEQRQRLIDIFVNAIYLYDDDRIDFAFNYDVETFQFWAIMLWENGFAAFFPADFFSDYPPVYLYVLFVIGMIRELLSLEFGSPLFGFITFLPSMIADLAIGYLVYKQALKHSDSEGFSLFAAGIWIFNPSVILISSVWGQVESVFTLIMFLSLIYLRDKKLMPAYVLFGLAILTKPQSLFLAPVYLYSAYSYIANHEKKPALKYTALSIGAGLLGMIIVSLPFGLVATIDQLIFGVGLYGRASVNAFNMWTLFGQNWIPVEDAFLGIRISIWGFVIAAAIIVGSMYALHFDAKKHKGTHLYLICAALLVSIFVFSVRMHERYMFPALLFLLLYYAERLEKHILVLYSLLSVTFFVNCIQVLRWAHGTFDIHIGTLDISMGITSLANIIGAFALIGGLVYRLRMSAKDREREDRYQITALKHKPKPKHEPEPVLLAVPAMKLRDKILLGVLIIAYSTLAFINLGDMRAPQTSWAADWHEDAWADFGENRHINELQFLTGASSGVDFTLYASLDNLRWAEIHTATPDHVYPFSWRNVTLDFYARYVLIVPERAGLRLVEVAFRDAMGEILPIRFVSENAVHLFDEQHLVPLRRGFMNSTYFDEIYHARTGYEFVHGLNVFEWTHPPLGKVFKAASIRAFGMTPFTYRLPGTVFGILMIPLMFSFGRRIFKSNEMGLLAAFIFTFDCMLFSQTRMATIDTYVTFFVLLMYYLMYRYISEINKNSLKQSLVLLGLCGAAMGLAIASKWQGIYGALGLPILFFPTLYKLYLRDKLAAKKTFFACFGLFVAVPIVIYMLSYIPYVLAVGGGVRAIWDNQINMFTYHSGLVAEHPFASSWWTWPLVLRPLWQYVTRLPNDMVQTMSSIGSPAVWWTGVAATAVAAYKLIEGWLKETRLPGSKEASFLLIAYAAQFLPWVPVARLTFIYHYFPSVPFVVLLIVWVFRYYVTNKLIIYAYAAVVLALFILFYPVLSGMPVSVEFARSLHWLQGWFFA